MALTKLPKNAFATGSVDDSKIEDGTIQNVELEDGTLTSEKFETGTIANASLVNSSITINGSSVSLGGTINLGTAIVADVEWQSVQTTGFTAVAGNGYFVDTTSGAITVTLPASASIGDTIAIKDYAGTFASNNLTIGRNGHNIQGVANDSLISTNRASLVLVYVDSTKGWLYAEESNVADLQAPPTYISATGGTVTTSGNYKIHSFTGDGCFVVSDAGSNQPAAGKVDYLVIAGGGSGGHDSGGGGGAGGYRESHCATYSGCYTASPLATPTSLSITATTYPVTVGGGGAGGDCAPGNNGSNSVFSTITSTGGGYGGGQGGSATVCGVSGGSGGGSDFGGTAGSGNTPPVSPPQGNNGGTGIPSPTDGAGGGGGAGAVGSNGSPPANGGPGGNGVTSSISGSPTTRAGGGGGGGAVGHGSGGSGGGGDGASNPNTNPTGYPGSANTGGGGGGGGGCEPRAGGTGGKGIVIIRYKFQ